MGFGKDGKGVIITESDIFSMLTLADNTALKQNNPLDIAEDFRMIKTEIVAEWRDVASSNGPLHMYLVNDELTVAEVVEAVQAGGPLNRNDRVAQERAERAVFLIGQFPEFKAGHSTELRGADGQMGVINKTIRWTFSNPEGWSFVVINRTGGALTTGSIVRFSAKHFGVWLS